MKKAQVEAKSRAIRKKEAGKLASAANSAPPYAPPPNADGEEFVKKLYYSNRTYYVPVPKRVVVALGLQPGVEVKVKIFQEGS
ncbi:MAG: hypothetical protein ABC596_09680 [Candidatus Methanosuratincola petrocarbonis]